MKVGLHSHQNVTKYELMKILNYYFAEGVCLVFVFNQVGLPTYAELTFQRISLGTEVVSFGLQ